MKKSVRDLGFHILNTRNPEAKDVALVESAFKFWRNSWEDTFQTLDVEMGKKLYADDFLDREVMMLVDELNPVALFFNSWFELRESQLSHSYFKNYPTQVFSFLREHGFHRTMILSYMTIHPEYRRSNTDLPITELLFSLGVLRFRSVPHEVLTGYIRTDLPFHEVFENHGGTKITRSHVYNVDVDYLYMTKESSRLSLVPGVADAADELWAKYFENSKLKLTA